MKKAAAEFELVRYQTQKDFGLDAQQIAERIEHNLTNEAKVKSTRSYFSIFVIEYQTLLKNPVFVCFLYRPARR